MNTMLSLEEQRGHDLDNFKRRQQIVNIYFNKKTKSTDFKVDEKVLLWDSTHDGKKRHSKF
jgi:hypothetical protein